MRSRPSKELAEQFALVDKAELAELEAENAAWREIGKAVVSLSPYDALCFCWRTGNLYDHVSDWSDAGEPHTPDCIYIKVRKLLGKSTEE